MGSFNVLLVDDETDFLNVLIRRVKRRGIDVCSARNAAEALECFAIAQIHGTFLLVETGLPLPVCSAGRASLRRGQHTVVRMVLRRRLPVRAAVR